MHVDTSNDSSGAWCASWALHCAHWWALLSLFLHPRAPPCPDSVWLGVSLYSPRMHVDTSNNSSGAWCASWTLNCALWWACVGWISFVGRQHHLVHAPSPLSLLLPSIGPIPIPFVLWLYLSVKGRGVRLCIVLARASSWVSL